MDPFTPDCPGREIFEHITSRWGALILVALLPGPLRFHLLRNRIGDISDKMLSQTLRVLTADALLARRVEPAIPPQVSYTLTALGEEAATLLSKLIEWIGEHAIDVLNARSDVGRKVLS